MIPAAPEEDTPEPVLDSMKERLKRQWEGSEQENILVEAPPFPKDIMLELSNACNHECLFCASQFMTRKVGRMDKTLLGRLLAEARQLGTTDVGFYTTGEPFVHKELEQFVAQARDLGFGYIYISTNGALASPKRLQALVEAGIHSIKFSINAATRETYRLIHGRDDFDAVLRNLRFISELRRGLDRKLRLFITYIVTNKNSHEVELFKTLFEPLVDELMFFDMKSQSGQMVQSLDVLAPSAAAEPFSGEPNTCTMPFNRVHISWEGYLTLCCIDYQNYLAVADLNKMSLEEGWLSPAFRELRRRHLEKRLEGTLCHNCLYSLTSPISPLVEELASPFDLSAWQVGDKKVIPLQAQ
ncbi:MAG: radical SAM protein [Magnetococcales bacterium]|nr:radical SAM protein [Magnetococcales bacterium]